MQRPPAPAAIPLPARDDLPRHVGIIMDGNGRWARQRHLPRVAGHRAGVRAIRPVMEACHRAGVHILTLYAFSTENWQRPRGEVTALMRLFGETIDREVGELHENGVQIRVLGDRARLSKSLQHKVAQAEALTSHDTSAILNVAINYGGRREIVDAVRELAASGADLTHLDKSAVGDALYTCGLPDPDLIVRTAGELRISNFLLWQAAYAELYVTDTLWPDFGETAIHDALADYSSRERKFGGIPEPDQRVPAARTPGGMNLTLRVVSGVVLVAVIVGALWIGTPAVATVVGAGALIGAWELRALLGRTGPTPPMWLMLPLSVWLGIRFVLPAADMAGDWAFAAAVVIGLLAGLGTRQSFAGWALAVGGATYVGLCLGFWVAIYRWQVPDPNHLGFRLVVLALAGAVIGDIRGVLRRIRLRAASVLPPDLAAQVGGGRGRRCRRLDPRWSIAGPWLVGISIPLGAGLGVLMAVAAQGGDLVKSAIKREAGVKDSGTLIPGHGGLLDRADSLVLLAPVVYCYLKLIAFS